MGLNLACRLMAPLCNLRLFVYPDSSGRGIIHIADVDIHRSPHAHFHFPNLRTPPAPQLQLMSPALAGISGSFGYFESK